jgi:hypothetical protein
VEERWQQAIEHAREYLGYYKEIGPTGMFGATIIAHNISRYENGERSQDLLDELEGIK